jgi:hypothetical protein
MKTIIIALIVIGCAANAQEHDPVLNLLFGKQNVRRATQLNGTSQYWSNANPTNFNFSGYQMLLMVWVRTNTTIYQEVLVKYKSAAAGRCIAINIQNGAVPYFYTSADGNGNANRASTVTVAVGNWYFIAATYTPSAMNIYVNGALSNGALTGSIPATLFDPVGTPLSIGVNGSLSSAYLNGEIGEAQIVRFTALPSDIAQKIMTAYKSKRFEKAYVGGEVVFHTDWKGRGIDISGKQNHVVPAGSAPVIDAAY